MQHITRIALCCAVLLGTSTVSAQTTRSSDCSEMLEKVCAKHDLPGMVAAVVDGDDIVISGAAGVRKRGTDVRVTIEDKFHIGSDTKAMTATLCAMLVEEGKLRWDITIAEVFPELVQKMHPDWKAVTLEQLLTNHGGAPAGLEKGNLWKKLWQFAGTPEQARQMLLEGVLAEAPEAPPGKKYIYSNAGFSIAGRMTEKVTGVAWEELITERLFKPLGMNSCGFGAPGTKDRIDQPLGHRKDGMPVDPGPGADNPPAISPAGRVHCTIADWAKFISLHLQQDRLLSKQSFEKLHEPFPDESRYAMGWISVPRPWAGGNALTHSGSNTMWYAVVWMSRSRNFGVLVMCNQGGDKTARACDEVAAALIAARAMR